MTHWQRTDPDAPDYVAPGYALCPVHDDLHDGGYVRHRHRMVLQAVYEDALILLKYKFPAPPLAGPIPPQSWLAHNSTDEDTVALLGDQPLSFIDYFPEGGMAHNEKVELNTLALSEGEQQDLEEIELGNGTVAQDYIFYYAFYTSSEAAAKALFSDLGDRYRGFGKHIDGYPFAITPTFITLHDYNRAKVDPHSDLDELKPIRVTRMEIEAFEFTKSSEETPPGTYLYLGRVTLRDYLEMG